MPVLPAQAGMRQGGSCFTNATEKHNPGIDIVGQHEGIGKGSRVIDKVRPLTQNLPRHQPECSDVASLGVNNLLPASRLYKNHKQS